MNLIEAIDDPNLFAPWYATGDWAQWRVFLKALFAIPPSRKKLNGIRVRNPDGSWSKTAKMTELEVYQTFTGRKTWPKEPFTEVWMPIGRRGGKSLNLAVIGVFLACFKDYRPYLQPGERGTVAIVAADRKQARVILRYVTALIKGIPMLKRLVQREWAEGFDLTNSVTIEVTTANSRTSRGYTFVAVLGDEVAFWSTDDSAADPDSEILGAMRPGMATIPGSMLLCASSPYARKGELWRNYKNSYGNDESDVLVWQAPSWVMNPTLPEKFIAREYAKDAESAKAEYGSEFRTDIEAFVRIEVVEACTDTGVFERPYTEKQHYTAFVDPSGGSADSFTLCIGHQEDERIITDLIAEVKPPFSPELTVASLVTTLKRYAITQVTGDRYAGEWPREQFRKGGIEYHLSAKPRTELYMDLLPSLNSKRVSLIDHPKLRKQLVDLERRTSRAGRDLIDHPRGGHDDVANCVAGLVSTLMKPAFESPVAVFGKYR